MIRARRADDQAAQSAARNRDRRWIGVEICFALVSSNMTQVLPKRGHTQSHSDTKQQFVW